MVLKRYWGGFQLHCPVCGWYLFRMPTKTSTVCDRCGLTWEDVRNPDGSMTWTLPLGQKLEGPWSPARHPLWRGKE